MLISENVLLLHAKKVVEHYYYKGVIPIREKEDVAMSIVEKFYTQRKKISKSYQHKASVTTYCISILNRMCCEIIRKDLRHWDNSGYELIDNNYDNSYSSSKNATLHNEIQYLEKIIKLFDQEKHIINIAFAYYFHLPVLEEDLKLYDDNYDDNKLRKFLPFIEGPKSELFYNLSKAVNIVENKQNKPDAIRIWFNKTMQTIINRLNGPFDRANYDKETFQSLFEHYYQTKTDRVLTLINN